MGMPQIPQDGPPTVDTNNAVALVVLSVAYEELALAHIINAEGEKIQKVAAAGFTATVDELLAINESVRDTLETVICKECILNMKLGKALDYLNAHVK